MKPSHHQFWIAGSVSLSCLVASYPTSAQIVPDATLPVNSTVIQQGPTTVIEGGTRTGGNLFHSFDAFSVPTGGAAYFNNALDINNILSRVTGGSISNIDGLIRANGTANLFLLNPNGIIFGPNARLNVGGSFLASTAGSFQFADGSFFSAAPSQTTPLLTISVPVGLQYGGNAAEIRVQGAGQNAGLIGISQNFDSASVLGVNPGNTLAIAGGNVIVDGGVLQAPGGRVELGGLAGAGTITINPDFSLTFPQGIARADVLLTNRAGVNVIGGVNGGGSIAIHAGSIGMMSESLLTSGLAFGLGDVNTRAGDITLNATNVTNIDQSRIENNVNSGTAGDSGDIEIQTGTFSLMNEGALNTTNFDLGFAGDIVIDAHEQVSVTNQASIVSNGEFGRILISSNKHSIAINNSIISTESKDNNTIPGQFSSIDLFAPSGSIDLNQTILTTKNFGTGLAGNITIEAGGQVSVVNSDISSDGFFGRISLLSTNNSIDINNTFITTDTDDDRTNTDEFSSINITAPSGAIVLNQNTISTTNKGAGFAGDITIEAGGPVSVVNSDIGSDGFLGSISLASTNNSLEISNSLITTIGRDENTDPEQFSSIDLLAPLGSVFLNQVTINTTNFGSGFAGDITIDASDRISITDSTISSRGNSGRIFIGSQVETEQGIFVSPILVTIDGVTTELATDNRTAPNQDAGLIEITAANVEINKAQLSSSTFGAGKAGDISVITSDSVFLVGSKLLTNVEAGATGQGGNIAIVAGSLTLTDGARLETSVLGPSEEILVGGNATAGNVSIDVLGKVTLTNGSAILSNINPGAEGKAGSIEILTRDFWMTNSAFLDSSSFGIGDAGSISIQAGDGSVFIAGTGSNIFSTVENGASGNAGNIAINAGAILIAEGAQLTSNNLGSGAAGNIALTALGQISLIDGSLTSTSNSDSITFGDISVISTQGSVFLDRAKLNTSNTGSGFAGDLTVNARNQIEITNESELASDGYLGLIFIGSSDITEEAFSARTVRIDNSTLSTTNKGSISPESVAINAGNIFIKAIDSVSLVNGSTLRALTARQGDAGSVTITAKNGEIALTDGSTISGTVEETGIGKGGDINLIARSLFMTNGARIDSSTFGIGNAGPISITADSFYMTSGAQLDSSSFGEGSAGVIDVQVPDGLVFLSGGNTRIFSTVEGFGTGSGGSINITARSLVLEDGAELQTLLRTQQEDPTGERTAGNINITTSEDVFFVGSRAFSNVVEDAIGNSGSVTVSARSIFIKDSAELNTNNFSSVLAGKITLNATDTVSLVNSSITSQTNNDNLRDEDVSSIRIAASEGSIFLKNSELNTTNKGSGYAGDIILNARDQISIADGSKISSDGNFGRILIGNTGIFEETYSPRAVTIDNSILNTTNKASTSDVAVSAGAIVINALESVSLSNQSFINAFTERLGNAGNVTIEVENGSLSLTDGSSIFNTVEPGGIGNGGNINITARSLSATEGSQIVTVIAKDAGDPSGENFAGNISIQATEDVFFAGFENDLANPGRFFPSGVRSSVDENAFGNAGNIDINARSIFVVDKAQLTSNNLSIDRAGTITLNASDLVFVANQGSITSTSNSSIGTSSSGTIRVTATEGSVVLTDRAKLDTTNTGSDFAGNIIISARDEIAIANNSSVSSEGSLGRLLIGSTENGANPPGVVRIDASTVSTTNPDALTVDGDFSFAGDIIINARDQVNIVNGSRISSDGRIGRILIGRTQFSEQQSSSPNRVSIDNSVLRTTNAGVVVADDEFVTAGDIAISAIESIALANKSEIDAFTQRLGNAGSVTLRAENGEILLGSGSVIFGIVEEGGIGKGGEINIRARSLFLKDGGQIQTSINSTEEDPTGTRTAGDINIRASGDVVLDGFTNVDLAGNEGTFPSAIFSSVDDGAVGKAGSVRINARSLSLRNRGLISVDGTGSGAQGAGNIDITAHSVQLEEGTLRANTAAGQGNIIVNSSALILRRGSSITTNAFGNETGGNITINTNALAALENSDITANAPEGKGGNVTINTQGIFGTAFRQTPTLESDITATGASSELSGTVEINTPDVDPSQGLVELPVQILDTENQIAQGCAAGKRNEFSVTGRGGLPPIPSEALGDNATWTDFRTPTGNESRSRGTEAPRSQGETPSRNTEIVEAQSWAINDKGEVVLTAAAPTATLPRSAFLQAGCHQVSTASE